MDGVIRHWLPEYLVDVEERFELPGGTISAAAFADPAFRDVTVGSITAEEWARAIGELVAAEHDVSAADVAEAWIGTTWRIDDEVVEMVRSLQAAGTTTAVFSNATNKLEEDMDSMGVRGLFSVIGNSSAIGMAKPDVEAFEHVAELLGVTPERLLFVDDLAENVGGAVDAGWHAVQMRSAERLGGVLRRLGIPGAPEPT